MKCKRTNSQQLYDRGRRYADRLSQLIGSGVPHAKAVQTLATEVRRPRPDVRAALAFAAAVDHIAGCAGPAARAALLSRGSTLPVKTVMQISRTHPDRIRYAMSRVQEGRSPFAPPPTGTDPPFDTLNYGEVVSRFARAAGLLDYVSRSAKRVVARLDVERVVFLASEIRRHCCAVATCLGELLTSGANPAGAATPYPKKGGRRASTVEQAGPALAAAAGLARKNGRDIARFVAEQPPKPEEAARVSAAIDRLIAAADRLVAARHESGRPAQCRTHPVTPGQSGGTYVVVFHLPTRLEGHVVGRLGTFDLPAGYHLYVGSAFGGGGVDARARRHLNPGTVKHWNVDYLKDRATPVEVWWTHDPVKRECVWSEVLAAMPGLTVPAPGFGSNDCSTCPAHLYHAERLPDFQTFEAAIGRIDGHAPVFRTTPAAFTSVGR